jgi:hypothetical protein
MAALIEWNTVGEIFAESIGAGVVIAAAFAYGARLVAQGADGQHEGRSPTLTYLLAGLCFLLAAAAVGYGVYFVVDK